MTGEKQIKILLVLDYINYNSGVSSVVMNYFFNSKEENISYDFLLYEGIEDLHLKQQVENKGAKIYLMGKPSVVNLKKYRQNVKKFFRKHKNEYDIVHAHIPNAAFIVLREAKRVGVPVRIVHSHNAQGADGVAKKIRNYFLNQWGIKYSNEMFACSNKAAKYLFGTRKLNQVNIIPNAIKLDRYCYSKEKRGEIRERLGVENKIVLGHIGRFVEQKNHEFLLQLLEKLKKENTQVKLLLLGDGKLFQQTQKSALDKGIYYDVIFAGKVNNIQDYLSAMDIFIMPSLYEGFPVVCVEAQASGLPCVFSDEITKEVKLCDNVSFLPITNIEQWEKYILSYINNSKIMIEQRKEKVSLDLNAYDIDKQVIGLEKKYRELVK